MDEADKRILRTIQANPDLTMRELGEQTGLSHTPCWRRLNRLREDGIVAEKKYVVDPRAAGYKILAYCFVRMKEHNRNSLEQFESAVCRIPEIMECHSATGNYDYILKVIAMDVDDYERTMKDALVELPSVAFINTSLALSEIKNTTTVPI